MTRVTCSDRTNLARWLQLLMLFLLPSDAAAQCVTHPLDLLLPTGEALTTTGAPTSLDEVRRGGDLQVGDGVYVTDASGCRIKADIMDVSPTGLALTDGRETWLLMETEIVKIERQDSLWNGIGLGLTASMVTLRMGDFSSDDLSAVVTGVTIVVGAGVLIGAVVDAHLHRTVYRASRSVWALGPIASADRTGVRMTVGW